MSSGYNLAAEYAGSPDNVTIAVGETGHLWQSLPVTGALFIGYDLPDPSIRTRKADARAACYVNTPTGNGVHDGLGYFLRLTDETELGYR